MLSLHNSIGIERLVHAVYCVYLCIDQFQPQKLTFTKTLQVAMTPMTLSDNTLYQYSIYNASVFKLHKPVFNLLNMTEYILLYT